MPVYTLKPGHARTFLTGAARRPGEAVEIASPGALGPADREALETHFDRADGPDGKPGGGAPGLLRNGLTEEQARAKLSKAGVTFADGVKGDGLADLFDRVFAPHTGTDAPSARNANQGEGAPGPGGQPPVQDAPSARNANQGEGAPGPGGQPPVQDAPHTGTDAPSARNANQGEGAPGPGGQPPVQDAPQAERKRAK